MKARVLHLCAIEESIQVILAPQLVYLREHGFDMHMACAPGPRIRRLEREIGARFHPVRITRRMDPLADLRSVGDLTRLFREQRFDIVHLHFPKSTLVGSIAARLAGVPLVVNTVRPMFQPHMSPLRQQVFMSVERFTALLCTRLLAQNPDDADYYPKKHICPRGKIAPLGNGIDIDHFHPSARSEAERHRVRAEMGLPADAFVVGMVGRYVREKGYEELFDTVAAMSKVRDDMRYLTAGAALAGARDGLPTDLPERKGLSGKGVQLGHVEDVRRVYAAMDVLVFPSHREACPRAPMEAAAMGLPVVASDLRGCRYSVIDGHNGFFFFFCDAAAFADRALALAADFDLRQRMGHAGRTLAEERFDQREVFARVADCYRELLRGRRS